MASPILDSIAQGRSLGVFLLVTVLLGGSAAWLTGRAVATTWRPWWHAAFYVIILGCVVRFLDFSAL